MRDQQPQMGSREIGPRDPAGELYCGRHGTLVVFEVLASTSDDLHIHPSRMNHK